VSLISVAIVLATFNIVQYWLSNKRLDMKRVGSTEYNGEDEKDQKRYFI